jgi:hypothetical protein
LEIFCSVSLCLLTVPFSSILRSMGFFVAFLLSVFWQLLHSHRFLILLQLSIHLSRRYHQP